ncbi:MAG TPA: hypothetical protein VNU01_13205 [Egibacteraceae bacterium]|nr:hypothetical protein [Egibacteraceae bacterium]
MDHAELQRLVDQADDAALLRAVDGLAASREWDLLETLRERCEQAVEMGRQLWGVAMHVDYRLAWEGPAAHAARAVERGSSRFTLGPLTEVASSTHEWAALEVHLRDPVVRATVAQERALRGEDLRGDASLAAYASLPAAVYRWEPDYALPVYRDRAAKFAQPDAAFRHVPLTAAGGSASEPFDDEATDALRDVVRTWWTQSAGRGAALGVEGDAAGAVRALRGERPGGFGLMAVESAEGLALLQWAGASGGAYGPRPGGAAGRFAAWWAAAALTGLDWPERVDDVFAGELGAACAQLRWYRWAGTEPDTGWTLRLAIEDPTDGLAWCLEAVDQREDEEA